MIKDKHSLKKVYKFALKNQQLNIIKEFQIKNFSKNVTNIKTLKDLYDKHNINANSDEIIDQTASTEITGLGTFDLTPIQIGLIGCIDQYYFGDKKLALKLTSVLQGIKKESRLKNKFKKDINENEENIDLNHIKKQKKIKLGKIKDLKKDKKNAISFINECVKNGIINSDYKINKGQTISQSAYGISKSSGYLFELFLCFYIQNSTECNNFTTNYKDTLKRLLSFDEVNYIASILLVIYQMTDFESGDFYLVNEVKIKDLYNKIFSHETNIFESLIKGDFKNKSLYFYFDNSGQPIDIVVFLKKESNKKQVISFIDLKTTSDNTLSSQASRMNTISGNIEKVSAQISDFKKYITENDFSIGNLKISYSYEKSNLNIKEKESRFIYTNVFYEQLKKLKSIKEKAESEIEKAKKEGDLEKLEAERNKVSSARNFILGDGTSIDVRSINSLKSNQDNFFLIQLADKTITDDALKSIANNNKIYYVNEIIERIDLVAENFLTLHKDKHRKYHLTTIVDAMFLRLLPKDFVSEYGGFDRIRVSDSKKSLGDKSPAKAFFTNDKNKDAIYDFYVRLFQKVIANKEKKDEASSKTFFLYQYALDIAYDIIKQQYKDIVIPKDLIPEGFEARKTADEYHKDNITVDNVLTIKNKILQSVQMAIARENQAKYLDNAYLAESFNKYLNKKPSYRKRNEHYTKFFSDNQKELSRIVIDAISLINNSSYDHIEDESDKTEFKGKVVKSILNLLKVQYPVCFKLLSSYEAIEDKTLEDKVIEAYRSFLKVKTKSKNILYTFDSNSTSKNHKPIRITFNENPESLFIFYKMFVDHLLKSFYSNTDYLYEKEFKESISILINSFYKNLFKDKKLNYHSFKDKASKYKSKDLQILIFLHDIVFRTSPHTAFKNSSFFSKFIKEKEFVTPKFKKDKNAIAEKLKFLVETHPNADQIKLKVIECLQINNNEDISFLLNKLNENIILYKKQKLLREVYKDLFK